MNQRASDYQLPLFRRSRRRATASVWSVDHAASGSAAARGLREARARSRMSSAVRMPRHGDRGDDEASERVQVAIPIVVVVFLALLAAGCESSEPTTGDTSATPLRLAVDDLRPLVTISPEATGWPWHVDPQTRVASPSSFKLDQSDPSYPIQKALRDAYQEAGHRSSQQQLVRRRQEGVLFRNLVATSAEATSAMEAEHEFARHWFPELNTKRFATSERTASVSKAGQCAAEPTTQVRRDGWTMANAVLSVYVTCNPCDSDVADAARRWAERIDEAAHAAAGGPRSYSHRTHDSLETSSGDGASASRSSPPRLWSASRRRARSSCGGSGDS